MLTAGVCSAARCALPTAVSTSATQQTSYERIHHLDAYCCTTQLTLMSWWKRIGALPTSSASSRSPPPLWPPPGVPACVKSRPMVCSGRVPSSSSQFERTISLSEGVTSSPSSLQTELGAKASAEAAQRRTRQHLLAVRAGLVLCCKLLGRSGERRCVLPVWRNDDVGLHASSGKKETATPPRLNRHCARLIDHDHRLHTVEHVCRRLSFLNSSSRLGEWGFPRKIAAIVVGTHSVTGRRLLWISRIQIPPFSGLGG